MFSREDLVELASLVVDQFSDVRDLLLHLFEFRLVSGFIGSSSQLNRLLRNHRVNSHIDAGSSLLPLAEVVLLPLGSKLLLLLDVKRRDVDRDFLLLLLLSLGGWSSLLFSFILFSSLSVLLLLGSALPPAFVGILLSILSRLSILVAFVILLDTFPFSRLLGSLRALLELSFYFLSSKDLRLWLLSSRAISFVLLSSFGPPLTLGLVSGFWSWLHVRRAFDFVDLFHEFGVLIGL